MVGVPRSGTTWTGQVLGGARQVHVVTEPDNEGWSPEAILAKRRLGRFPVLDPGTDAPAYHRLWRWAFAGAPAGRRQRLAGRLLRGLDEPARQALVDGRPTVTGRLAGRLAAHPPTPGPAATASGPRVVAKSVHAVFALEWLTAAFDVEVVVLLRHPASIYASWVELGLPDRDRGLDRRRDVLARFVRPMGLPAPGPGPQARAMWQLGLLLSVLEATAARHPEWQVRTHEELCEAPGAEFRRLCDALGLEWSPEVDARLQDRDVAGTGYSTRRRTSRVAEAWETRLAGPELDELRRALAPFPLRRWADDGFGRRP